MRLPLNISLDKTADELEVAMRDAIRKDTGMPAAAHEIGLIIFAHEESGAVAFMHEAQYRIHQERYEVVLNQMGWTQVRSFQAPTCHAGKLRSVT